MHNFVQIFEIIDLALLSARLCRITHSELGVRNDYDNLIVIAGKVFVVQTDSSYCER